MTRARPAVPALGTSGGGGSSSSSSCGSGTARHRCTAEGIAGGEPWQSNSTRSGASPVSRQASGTARSASGTPSSRCEKPPLRLGCSDAVLLGWVCEELEVVDGCDAVNLLSLPESKDSQSRLTMSHRCLTDRVVDCVACADEDVVAEIPDNLLLAAVLPRGDASEAVVMKAGGGESLDELPAGATVCVSSPRQRLQLTVQYPHLLVVQSSATIQKQLRRLHSGDYDACITSAALLDRWSFNKAAGDFRLLDISQVMPAFGQGMVGLLCRVNDKATVTLLKGMDDPASRTCAESERALVQRLELLGGATAGGVAQLQPDGQLHLRCLVARPGPDAPTITPVERVGSPEDISKLVRDIATESAKHMVQSLLSDIAKRQENGREAPGDAESADESDSDEEDDEQGSKVLPPLQDAEQRLQVEDFDTAGLTSYEGVVATVFPNGGGALVDVNCEVPARWYPEKADDESQLPELGTQVSVYFCQGQRQRLLAVREQPPRLLQRGRGERLLLEELKVGEGPFRAVVISCTSAGILVDFNCEVAGRLVSNRSHTRGEELRVYCLEANTTLGTCTVTERRQEKALPRKRLMDLYAGTDTAFKGTVRRIMDSGALVDFNCEVMGYLGAMDMDIDALPDGLIVGREVTVFISSLDVTRQRVSLSMFRPRAVGAAPGWGAQRR